MRDTLFQWIASNAPWAATLACVLFSVRIAGAFLRENPRLFAVMALFAFQWALLLQYWAVPASAPSSQLEFIPVYTGFLSVFIGGVLVLHARAAGRDHAGIVWLQGLGLYLLILVVSPLTLLAKLGDPTAKLLGEFVSIDKQQTQLVVGAVMDILGFSCIVWGVRELGTQRADKISSVVIALILLFYSAIEVLLVIQFLVTGNYSYSGHPLLPYFPDPEVYPYLFAAMKCIYTLAFGSAVAYHGMTDADWKANPSGWIKIFASRKLFL